MRAGIRMDQKTKSNPRARGFIESEKKIHPRIARYASNRGVSGSLLVALDLEILLGYLDKLLACPGSQTFPALRHTPARPPRVRYSPT